MKRIQFFLYYFLICASVAVAQDDIYPAQEYKGLLFITNATIHVGNGQVINNGTIQVNNGKIEKVIYSELLWRKQLKRKA